MISPYSLYVIEEKEKSILYDFSEMIIEKLARELIDDIEKDLDGWSVEFVITDNQEEITQHRNEIIERIAKLKELLENNKEKYYS